jgi:hypothetical protein
VREERLAERSEEPFDGAIVRTFSTDEPINWCMVLNQRPFLSKNRRRFFEYNAKGNN